jgi:hypothetical protein
MPSNDHFTFSVSGDQLSYLIDSVVRCYDDECGRVDEGARSGDHDKRRRELAQLLAFLDDEFANLADWLDDFPCLARIQSDLRPIRIQRVK